MSTALPPLCHKKIPSTKTVTDTFRVIREDPGPCFDSSTDLSVTHCMTHSVNILGQPVLHPPANESRNRPCPRITTHLTSNVRTMMAPIPLTRTQGADPDYDGSPASPWWEHSSSLKPALCAPQHSFDSTSRYDYQYRGSGLPGSRRHGFKSSSSSAIIGVSRTTDEGENGKRTFWKEGVSYEHQYNSRTDPNYPVRGKRRGTFVLNKLPPTEADRMLSFCGYTDVNGDRRTCSRDVAVDQSPSSLLAAA